MTNAIKRFYLQLTIKKLFLLALVLCLPALFAGFITDDVYHQNRLQGIGSITPPENASLLGLFSLFQSDPAYIKSLMLNGVLPWWTSEDFTLNFWRPISELSHILDHIVAPNNSYFAHVQSIIWYFLLAFLSFHLYQRISSENSEVNRHHRPAIAFIALCIFLLDSTHGPTIAWIANRNAIIASTFAVAALLLHIISVERKSFKHQFLAIVMLILALLSGEYAVAIGAYFFAYALFKDPSGAKIGFLRIFPYLIVVFIWLATYKNLGFGASGSYNVQYIDPISYPLEFLYHAIARVPALLFSQLGVIPAEFYSVVGLIHEALGWIYAMIAFAFVLWLLKQFFNISQSRKTTLFWITAMVISAIPISSTVPFDRTLLLTGIAGSALLAEFLIYSGIFHSLHNNRGRDFSSNNKKPNKLASSMLVIHLAIAPVLLPLTLIAAKFQGQFFIDQARALQVDNKRQDYILMWGAITSAQYVNFTRSLYGDTNPRSFVLLSNHLKPITLKRTSDATIEMTQENGFIFKTDNIYRDTQKDPFHAGDRIELPHLMITVKTVTPDHRPLTITVRSAVNWGSDQLKLLIQESGEYKTLSMPTIGNSIRLE